MDYVNELSGLLESSVERSCGGLSEVGLLFSAGVDSTLVGVIASKFAKVRAYNVGFSESHDAAHARESEGELPFSVDYVEISGESVEKELSTVVSAVGEPNSLKVAVAVPFYFAAKKAGKDGLNVMLCGQGADELFGGYNRYVNRLAEGGYDAISRDLSKDVDELWDAQLRFDVSVAKANSMELRFPFLDDEFKKAALAVPASEKIKTVEGGCEYACVDEVGGKKFVRKYALRRIAGRYGVPKPVINRTKKAAQYGSGSEKLLKSIARKNGFSGRGALREYIQSFFD